MEKINFQNVLPQVFQQRHDLTSEVWLQNIHFEKEHLYLDNENIAHFDMARWTDLRQHHISYLFQELRLFPELTAWENVLVKNNLTHFQTETTLKTWFQQLGIADKMQTKAAHMSFGQQQRVAMIRALAQPFDFILVDEPISHLDDTNAAIMADIMMTEAHRQGAGIIVTSIGKHMNIHYEKTFQL